MHHISAHRTSSSHASYGYGSYGRQPPSRSYGCGSSHEMSHHEASRSCDHASSRMPSHSTHEGRHVSGHQSHHTASNGSHKATSTASTSINQQPATIIEINNPVIYIGGQQTPSTSQTYNSAGSYNNASSGQSIVSQDDTADCHSHGTHKPFFSDLERAEINKAYVDSMIGYALL